MNVNFDVKIGIQSANPWEELDSHAYSWLLCWEFGRNDCIDVGTREKLRLLLIALFFPDVRFFINDQSSMQTRRMSQGGDVPSKNEGELRV